MNNKLPFLPLILLAILFSTTLHADEYRKEIIKRTKTLQVTSIDSSGCSTEYKYPDENLVDIFSAKLDSLAATWYFRNAFDAEDIGGEDLSREYTTTIPDSVYIKRLANINSFIELSYNGTVRRFIELYSVRRKALMERMLGLSRYYFPMFEEALYRHNLPLELKYLPIIESALNPTAGSHAGARGLWQFMYWTGKSYGLEMSSYVDERHDPYASTEAAVKFLKTLYKIYGDWHLVIAAYNCGPGTVNKAIRRSGGTRDYWKIYYRLPRETRGYVPSFIAAVYAMNYHSTHGIELKEPSFPIVADTVMVRDYVNLKQVSVVMGLPLEQLREYNPQYKADVIPATASKAYSLRLPQTMIGEFIDREREVLSYKRNEFFPQNKLRRPGMSIYASAGTKGRTKVYYKVRSGDVLGLIADWYDVNVRNIREWNNIRKNMIRVGQKLAIYVPKSRVDYYRGISGMSREAKRKLTGKSAPKTVASSSEVRDSKFIYHVIQSGENLWVIARGYPGVSAQNIMDLNGITDSKKITVGQKIKIRSIN